MTYLFDADTLIEMIRGLKSNRRPALRRRALALVERVRRVQAAGDVVAVSAITVSELEFGARLGGKYDDEMSAVRKLLMPFELIGYDAELCPPEYGRIRHELESRGVPIGAMDLLLAAQAAALGAVLVSNNTAHFSRVSGLVSENWLQE